MGDTLNVPKFEWKGVTLLDVVSILGDGLHGTPRFDDSGEYYFINGNNLNNGKIVIKENTKRTTKEEYEKYKKDLNERSILVSINGTLGNIALYNKEKCFLGKSACYFNILDTVDKSFIRYTVVDKKFQDYISNFAHGTTIQNVSLKTMREYPFLLPPLPEQKAIASVLSSLDDKIDLLHRQNKTLEAMEETLFRQWFVEEAQEDWAEGKLGELVTITRGASPRPIIQYVKNGTVPWIKIADATGSNSFYINSTKEFIAYLGFNTPLLAAQEKKYYELADGEADPKESQCIVVDVSFRFCSEIPKISDYGGGRFTTKEYMPRDKQAI